MVTSACRGVFGALVAGLIAGLWGVTGWGGFLYYVAMHCVVRGLLHVPWICCRSAHAWLMDQCGFALTTGVPAGAAQDPGATKEVLLLHVRLTLS